MLWLAVGLAGAAGASCRHLVDRLVTARAAGAHAAYPWGTTVVNLSGSLVAGLVAGAVTRGLPAEVATVAAAGFCGAYTTFASPLYDAWRAAEEGRRERALSSLGMLALAGVAVAAGWALTAA